MIEHTRRISPRGSPGEPPREGLQPQNKLGLVKISNEAKTGREGPNWSSLPPRHIHPTPETGFGI